MGPLNYSAHFRITVLHAIMNGPTRPTLNCPCSSAVEHSLGKGEVSGSSPDEGTRGVDVNLSYEDKQC